MRPTTTLPLPGDTDTVLAADLALAIRRDGRLNHWERTAKIVADSCRYSERDYRRWGWSYECSYAPGRPRCLWCWELA